MDDITKRDDTDITPAQATAIAALLSGATQYEAAVEAGVARSTLWRWRTQDRAFMARLSEERQAMVEDAINALAGGARSAATVLVEIFEDPTINPAVRVQAAQALLSKSVTSKASIEVDATFHRERQERKVQEWRELERRLERDDDAVE